jgi:tRNA-Thr(GGU) m(6)t(6)A37 methyltransferase TsaA
LKQSNGGNAEANDLGDETLSAPDLDSNTTAQKDFISHQTVNFQPIGLFHCDARFPYEVPRQACFADPSLGRIEFYPGRHLEEALEQVETFSHIWLIYVFHKNKHWKPKVQPPRGSQKKIGVLATRAPYRPNPIGMSSVRFERRQGLTIWVRNHDLLDSTPILDIKPYVPHVDHHANANQGWIQDELEIEILWDPLAEEQATWIEEMTQRKLRQFLVTQLGSEPFNHKKKRVRALSSQKNALLLGLLSFRTWRCLFHQEEISRLRILRIYSGYTPTELDDRSDPHLDKLTHRRFCQVYGEESCWSETKNL